MLALNTPTIRSSRRIALAEIDTIVAARLGPGRVRGNAQPAAFSRQVAMYIANQVGGWSTTQIGKFYNGRDHSTVCYAISRMRARRQTDQRIDELLTLLETEIRQREHTAHTKVLPNLVAHSRAVGSQLPELVLETLAEQIASRVLFHLTELQRSTTTGKSQEHESVEDPSASGGSAIFR